MTPFTAHITTPGTHAFVFTNRSVDITLTIAHARAKVVLYGIFDARKDAHYTVRIRQHHTVSGGTSATYVNGVFRDNASLDFVGTIAIDDGAHGCSATLVNRNYLLSARAHVRSVPQMEVVPHDVTCTHACTISAPPQEALTYLMQRGISRTRAATLLAHGLLEDLLRKSAHAVRIT